MFKGGRNDAWYEEQFSKWKLDEFKWGIEEFRLKGKVVNSDWAFLTSVDADDAETLTTLYHATSMFLYYEQT